MPSKKVTLRHPKLPDDQTITVAERSVYLHEAAGWKRAPKSEQPAQPEPSTT